jgi:hypothetical protein
MLLRRRLEGTISKIAIARNDSWFQISDENGAVIFTFPCHRREAEALNLGDPMVITIRQVEAE